MGDFLQKYCPVEYDLIIQAKREKNWVTADTIEEIAYHSNNPAFKSPEFRKALGDFRRYKLRTPNPAQFDLDKEVRAIKRKLQIE